MISTLTPLTGVIPIYKDPGPYIYAVQHNLTGAGEWEVSILPCHTVYITALIDTHFLGVRYTGVERLIH